MKTWILTLLLMLAVFVTEARTIQLLAKPRPKSLVVLTPQYFFIHFPLNQLQQAVGMLPVADQQRLLPLLERVKTGRAAFLDLSRNNPDHDQLRRLIMEDVGGWLLLQGQAFIETAKGTDRKLRSGTTSIPLIESQLSAPLNQADGSQLVPVVFYHPGTKVVIFSGTYRAALPDAETKE